MANQSWNNRTGDPVTRLWTISGAVAHASKQRRGARRAMRSAAGRRVWEIHRPTVRHSWTTLRVVGMWNVGDSCQGPCRCLLTWADFHVRVCGNWQQAKAHLTSAQMWLWIVMQDRCSSVIKSYQRLVVETSAPYRLDSPLLFVLRHPCIWYAGHGRGEANKQSTNNKCGATGDNYPAHIRPIVRRSLVSIHGSGEIPFLRFRKKIETNCNKIINSKIHFVTSEYYFFAKLTIIHQSIYNTCKLEDFFKAPYNVKMLFSMDHSTNVILSHCESQANPRQSRDMSTSC